MKVKGKIRQVLVSNQLLFLFTQMHFLIISIGQFAGYLSCFDQWQQRIHNNCKESWPKAIEVLIHWVEANPIWAATLHFHLLISLHIYLLRAAGRVRLELVSKKVNRRMRNRLLLFHRWHVIGDLIVGLNVDGWFRTPFLGRSLEIFQIRNHHRFYHLPA